jgi:hypothetical protein
MYKVDDNSGSITMNKGDGAEVTQSKYITLRVSTDCEIIIIDTIDG